MSESLADIETLALRCRAERAREYIAEAIQCYRAGAYRSAIVNSWIAVVFDLVDKIRELALAGDATAQAINYQYETYLVQINAGNEQGIRSALEFERTILATCRDRLQLLDHQQMRDLERLREDRHQCAHPSFQRAGEPHRPSAELARLHLRTSVDHVLSQPPVQGRSAIAELVTIVASNYYPRDRFQAAVALRNTPIANANPALVKGFVDGLLFGFIDSASPLYEKIQVGSAVCALLDTQRALAEPRISQQLNKLVRTVDDQTLSLVAILISSIPEAINLIDDPSRVRIMEFVRTAPEADVIKSIQALAIHPEIASAALARIQNFDIERLSEAISMHGFGELAKERALSLLSEAGSWGRANDVFDRLVMPIFERLNREDIERIIRMPTETGADLPGATGYGNFVSQLRHNNLISEMDLDALLRAHNASYLVRARQ